MTNAFSGLSKSNITAFEQCPRRLWLQTHREDLIVVDEAAQARIDAGNLVSKVACGLHPGGIMVEAEPDLKAAIDMTQELIADGTRTIFEGTFTSDGVLVRVDVMEPDGSGGWHVAEVKSSTSPKDYHVGDLATQIWVLERCGIRIASANVRHINNAFVLQSVGDYDGLFKNVELSADIRPVMAGRADVVAAARNTLVGAEPECATGTHCHTPFDCEFQHWCSRNDSPPPEWPIADFPRSGSKLALEWAAKGITDIRELPDDAGLNPQHEKIRRAVVSGEISRDQIAVARDTQDWAYPRIWIDFETIAFPVPIWLGTSPWKQIPFQFSAHIEQSDGRIAHVEGLDVTGDDPRPAIAAALAALPSEGAVIAWNASFERSCFRSLADAVPEYAPALLSLEARTVDLLPVARSHFYHRDQRGSWSIKAVLPTIAPALSYSDLQVKDGGNAQLAYMEAIALKSGTPRKRAIEAALKAYCERDTWAMVAIYRGLTCESLQS